MENNGDEVAILFPEGHLALRFSVFTNVQSRFSSYFFFFCFCCCFYFRKRKSADIYEKYLFLVFFGATDGNFKEKYSVTPS